MSAACAEAPPLNPVMAIVRNPLALAQAIALTMFREFPRRTDRDEHVARSREGRELVAENVVIADVVGDRGDQFDGRGQTRNSRLDRRARSDALETVAGQMIGDGRGAAIAAGEDRAAAGDDVDDRVRRGLHPLARDRRRRVTKKVKVGVEIARHVLVKSVRKKSQDKPPRKRGVLRYPYDVLVCSNPTFASLIDVKIASIARL